MDGRLPGAVVVGVDASDSARYAAEWAADIAAVWAVPLHLVHVVPGAEYDPPPGLRPNWLTELCDAAIRAGADPQGTEVVLGGTVELLADRAAGARLLVLGSYGSGAWSGMLAGSVALALLARVRCPVVIVRGSAPQIPPPRRGPIVVGVDGSQSGRAALAFAADLAAALGARLTAVHAWTDVAVGPDGALHRVDEDPALRTERGAELLDAELAPITATHPGLPIAREVIVDTPLQALLATAPEARLLVVGQRDHRPDSAMALGSTSQALVEFAPCPVAVVRPGMVTGPPASDGPGAARQRTEETSR
jgi:nucleotide-binding universal stress UspA family protein